MPLHMPALHAYAYALAQTHVYAHILDICMPYSLADVRVHHMSMHMPPHEDRTGPPRQPALALAGQISATCLYASRCLQHVYTRPDVSQDSIRMSIHLSEAGDPSFYLNTISLQPYAESTSGQNAETELHIGRIGLPV